MALTTGTAMLLGGALGAAGSVYSADQQKKAAQAAYNNPQYQIPPDLQELRWMLSQYFQNYMTGGSGGGLLQAGAGGWSPTGQTWNQGGQIFPEPTPGMGGPLLPTPEPGGGGELEGGGPITVGGPSYSFDGGGLFGMPNAYTNMVQSRIREMMNPDYWQNLGQVEGGMPNAPTLPLRPDLATLAGGVNWSGPNAPTMQGQPNVGGVLGDIDLSMLQNVDLSNLGFNPTDYLNQVAQGTQEAFDLELSRAMDMARTKLGAQAGVRYGSDVTRTLGQTAEDALTRRQAELMQHLPGLAQTEAGLRGLQAQLGSGLAQTEAGLRTNIGQTQAQLLAQMYGIDADTAARIFGTEMSGAASRYGTDAQLAQSQIQALSQMYGIDAATAAQLYATQAQMYGQNLGSRTAIDLASAQFPQWLAGMEQTERFTPFNMMLGYATAYPNVMPYNPAAGYSGLGAGLQMAGGMLSQYPLYQYLAGQQGGGGNWINPLLLQQL